MSNIPILAAQRFSAFVVDLHQNQKAMQPTNNWHLATKYVLTT